MLLKKGSVKGIGEPRHLGWRVFISGPRADFRWDLVINFFCGEPTRVTSFAAGDYVGYRRLGSCGKANYNVFWFSIGPVQTLFRDSPKPLKTKQ
jgi:hypothetical protein